MMWFRLKHTISAVFVCASSIRCIVGRDSDSNLTAVTTCRGLRSYQLFFSKYSLFSEHRTNPERNFTNANVSQSAAEILIFKCRNINLVLFYQVSFSVSKCVKSVNAKVQSSEFSTGSK